jgi:hypothetical protein
MILKRWSNFKKNSTMANVARRLGKHEQPRAVGIASTSTSVTRRRWYQHSALEWARKSKTAANV